MNYFDRRPQVFRVVFGVVALFLAIFAGFDIYQFGRSPTDENLFQDPPSRVYVTKSFPAEREETQGGKLVMDSLLPGDLIQGFNEKKFPSLNDGLDYIRTLDSTAMLTLQVRRPAEGKSYVYRVHNGRGALKNIRELQPTALVVDVTPGGASDRAGLKVGDHILRINGQSFKNVNEADAILTRGQIGKTIDYEVLRNNETMTLHVTLASFGLQFAFLVIILCGLFTFMVGVFLAEVRPQFAATRLLGIFFAATGYIMAVTVTNRGLVLPWAITIRTWTLGGCVFAFFPVLLHSMHYFPQDRPDLLKRKWIRIGGYILSLLTIVGIPLLPHQGGLLFIASMLYIFIVPMIYRKSCPPGYRSMNRVVRWTGAGIAVITVALGFGLSQQGGIEVLRLIAWYGVILLALPMAYLYTIGRHRLFNLALHIRRSVQYSFVSVVWTVVLIALFSATLSFLVQTDLRIPYLRFTSSSIEITETPTSQREQTLIGRGILAGLAIFAASAMMRLQRSGGRFISEKFYRTRYDYRRAANELGEVMSTTLNMTQLAKGIVEKLASLMHVKRVGLLFFRDQDVCCCHEAYGFNGTTWDSFCMSIDNHVIDGLRGFTREASVASLPPPLNSTFKAEEFHYVVPIRSKEKLVGALLVGEKMSESAFTPEDLEFLGAVSRQASVAIENAFLYEELAEQERLKHELAIARRIQLESLPQSTPEIQGLEISGISIPALEVGGDYFDYLNGDPSKLTVIVGDVSGKGTSAALYMSKVQGILRSLHAFGLSPRELFIRANHLLCRDLEKKSFVTAMGAAFDTDKHKLMLARAGHLPLFHFSAASRRVERIIPRGLGLGLSPEDLFATELEERCVSYASGDVFLFVTDGITEGQQRTGDEYGEERLVKILEENSGEHAVVLRDRVIEEVKTFAGDASQHDDQTVVVVKVT